VVGKSCNGWGNTRGAYYAAIIVAIGSIGAAIFEFGEVGEEFAGVGFSNWYNLSASFRKSSARNSSKTRGFMNEA